MLDTTLMPAISMQDDLGIVYVVENAQQFWSELEDVLRLPTDEPPTLSLLDSMLRRFLALCATYHEQYLQSPLQLEHACHLILDSELFEFHSERMCEIIVDDTQSTTDPHSQLISYHLLLCYGHRRPDFFRSHKRWQPLMPLLMDHVLVEIDADVEDTYFGTGGGPSNYHTSVPVPIEAKLRSLGVKLLYEVCRVQKLSVQDLRIFDDTFIDYLFDLVEQTRYMHDDTFNYSVIKLIVALNEQFMVASLPAQSDDTSDPAESKNRVLRVLMRRLGSSKTFGENMIFMLNRAERTPEDLCMQLLILKILYVLFTTKGTSEYFYTNDLCVLVDVFLRELVDLDEDSESLRHTYLRVLHPLLTKTQLQYTPYKRPQILYALESLVGNSRVRDVNPTTKRLVDRCLAGEWCVQLRDTTINRAGIHDPRRRDSDTSDLDSASALSPSAHTGPTSMAAAQQLGRTGSMKRALKSSKSVENLRVKDRDALPMRNDMPRSPMDKLRRPSNGSTYSLPGVTTAAGSVHPIPISSTHSYRLHSNSNPSAPASQLGQGHAHDPEHQFHTHHHQLLAPSHSPGYTPSPIAANPSSPAKRRPPPPAPSKRRKPPAIPTVRTNSGTTITTIRSSEGGK
ncbi:hypothetical protein BDQ12DRAFT_659958 [Crucibulum laeve]|uniref:SPIN90/Ldb17 leucine-rich domain-containing protein n=1 Tax=Crucibulum laeve TaxID=68775 RepID=A0A5C3LI20_9AGAR|nr:hypothetical protein BDQ12DRAFT_659958 [Crucibulum laeve]